MHPPWLPKNVQKRLLRSVLSRIALFDEIALENLDIQLFSLSNSITLHDVRLNVDVISLPGMFLNGGNAGSIVLRLPRNILNAPIEIELSNVDVTVSPSKSSPSTEEFLTQTTSNLATSFLDSESPEGTFEISNSVLQTTSGGENSNQFERNESSDEDEDLGFGTGGLNLQSVMTKILDLIFRQLKITVKGLSIKVVLQDLILQGTIDLSELYTGKDGVRVAKFNGLQFSLPPDLDDTYLPFVDVNDVQKSTLSSFSSSTDSSTDNGLSSPDGDESALDNSNQNSITSHNRTENSLSESTYFSKEEAGSIYLSAMASQSRSSVENNGTPRLLWCDELEVSIFGSFLKTEFRVGCLKTGLAHFDLVTNAFSEMLKGVLSKSNGSRATNSGQPQAYKVAEKNNTDQRSPIEKAKNIKLGISRIEISLGSDLNQSGNFVSEKKTTIILEHLYSSINVLKSSADLHNTDETITPHAATSVVSVDSIQAVAQGKKIMWFDALGDRKTSPDMYIQLTSSAASVNVPHNLAIKANSDVLEELVMFYGKISRIFNNYTASPSISKPIHARADASFQVIGNFGSADLEIYVHDQITPCRVVLKPIKFTHNKLSTKGVLINLQGGNLEFDEVLLDLNPLKRYLDRDIELGTAKEKAVSSHLKLTSINLSCDLKELKKSMDSFLSEGFRIMELLHRAIDSSSHTQGLQPSSMQSTIMPTLVTAEQIDIVTNLPQNTGAIRTRLENTEGAIFKQDKICLDIDGIVALLHRDSVPTIELIGPVLQDWKKGRAMVSLVIKDDTDIIANIYNLRYEYKVDVLMPIIESFTSISQTRNNEEKQPLFQNNKPDFSSEYDIIESDDNNEFDDEEYYRDKHFKRLSLDHSVATFITSARKNRLSLNFRDCAVGLNPLNLPSRALLVITDGNFDGNLKDMQNEIIASVNVRRATLFLVDDVANIQERFNIPQYMGRRRLQMVEHLSPFINMGYVNVASMSSATAKVKIGRVNGQGTDGEMFINVEARDDLLFVETCPDSTQTLFEVMNGLKLPVIVDNGTVNHHTEILPVDLLASLDEVAFKSQVGVERSRLKSQVQTEIPKVARDIKHKEVVESALNEKLSVVESYYSPQSNELHNSSSNGFLHLADVIEEDGREPISHSAEPIDLNGSEYEQFQPTEASDVLQETIDKLEIMENHFGGKNLMQTTLLRGNTKLILIEVRDVHVLWNLHDGYDWPKTRDVISNAVRQVEGRALDAIRNRQEVNFEDDDNESIIGDFLFNSIYIGIPSGNDPQNLRNQINMGIDDESETASQVSSTSFSRPSSRAGNNRLNSTTGNYNSKLRLKRSKTHKIQVELKGVSFDFSGYSETAEIASSIDLKIRELEIFDNVSTSTWRKFVTGMYSVDERDIGSSMAHIELLNVRPSLDLQTSEAVIKVDVLPLRLYVDQDALDFLTRFFTFKNDSITPPIAEELPFLQRVELSEITVKLDYKPKKIDFAGLRSGHTTEFMNFFVLDEAKITLRHAVLYGVLGFPRLFEMLNNIWLPDIKSTQLGDVLAGVAPVKSLVKLGGGVRDLVVVPIREYKKDGRIVRSIQKGATQFAKVTTNELVSLGAKLAVGTQNVLENAESFIVGSSDHENFHRRELSLDDFDEIDSDDESLKTVSMYADQPRTVAQGLQRAYSSLNRNFGTARDIIAALPAEAREQSGTQQAAMAIARAAPVAVLRSMIGATEAMSNTLMGVNNQLDPQRRRNMEDVSFIMLRYISGF
ncbi:hypothetical protein V1514DRAFT_338184 [Lipomyces japonicus]|uniref:uncharacterized protein n=1 Tax=Lipomyces japonicus TaxID=56871 RepID=UPI0034CEE895